MGFSLTRVLFSFFVLVALLGRLFGVIIRLYELALELRSHLSLNEYDEYLLKKSRNTYQQNDGAKSRW